MAKPVPRIFVSHSSADSAFAERLVSDLRRAGADAWIYEADDTAGNIIARIDEMLARCDWLVLVLSPNSIASNYVQMEVNVALNRVNQGYMQGVVPIMARAFSPGSLTPVWAALRRFDASGDYPGALAGLLGALRLSKVGAYLTEPLVALGFRSQVAGGVSIILPPMRFVPGGSFTMGSNPRHDPHSWADEQPRHRVKTAEYYIAQYPVTVAEYACYTRPKGDPGETAANVDHSRLDHPVKDVSWYDARDYVEWLARLTEQRWRLPTEAEWEKAARYDAVEDRVRIYPWEGAFDARRCNSREGGKRNTTPVGSFPSGQSPCGAHDMAGNVWEWTSSLHRRYPYVATDSRENLDAQGLRVRRGGAFNSDQIQLRAAYRAVPSSPDGVRDNSFRLVCEDRIEPSG